MKECFTDAKALKNLRFQRIFRQSAVTHSVFVLPDGVTTIENNADSDVSYQGTFAGCISLEFIKIPEGITKIGHKMFYGCISLSEIVIPKSVVKIEKWAFMDCHMLSSVQLLNSETQISDHAFDNCKSVAVSRIE